jgi:hypothetical protein
MELPELLQNFIDLHLQLGDELPPQFQEVIKQAEQAVESKNPEAIQQAFQSITQIPLRGVVSDEKLKDCPCKGINDILTKRGMR